MSQKVYQIVADKIIKALDEGRIPWIKDWECGDPYNAISKKPYRGINWMLLQMSGRGPAFMTLKQANTLGGKIRKGTPSELVTFWSKIKKKEGTPDESEFFMFRYYTVFPVSDIESLPERFYKKPEARIHPDIAEADAVIAATGAEIKYGGQRACFIPSQDIINMPHKHTFEHVEQFYSTSFHELVHWTGAKPRLARDTMVGMNSEYSAEELVAEIGAACACARLGIDMSHVLKNAQAYCQGWASRLKGEKASTATSCASKAFKAVDYIFGGAVEVETEMETEEEHATV